MMMLLQAVAKSAIVFGAKLHVWIARIRANKLEYLARALGLGWIATTALVTESLEERWLGLALSGLMVLGSVDLKRSLMISLAAVVVFMIAAFAWGGDSICLCVGVVVVVLNAYTFVTQKPYDPLQDGSFDKNIGFDPFAESTIQNPYPFYQVLRTERPLYYMKSADYYVVSRYRDIQFVTKRTETFSSNLVAILLEAGNGKQSLLSKPDVDVIVDVLALADPPLHTKQRKIAMAGLSPKLFLGLESSIRAETIKMLEALCPPGQENVQIDWMDKFALRLPMKVALNLCGLPVDNHRQVKEWADHGVALLAGINTAEDLANHSMEALKLLTWVKDHFHGFLRAKDLPQESKFLCALIEAVRSNDLTAKEAISMIFQILLAGNDSSASTIGSSVHFLLDRPNLRQLLTDDPGQIPAFIEEVLRMESPFGGHFRKVTEDIDLHGQRMRKGSRVMVLWASGNRDPEVFQDPDEFKLHRTNASQHLAFGKGIHACMGQKLAKLEVKIVLEELLKSYTIAHVPNPPIPVFVNSVFVRSLETLPILLGKKTVD